MPEKKLRMIPGLAQKEKILLKQTKFSPNRILKHDKKKKQILLFPGLRS